jgi:hypothetical protein
MAPILPLFGRIFLVKNNPWFSGTLAEWVAKGLAKPKKQFVLARPPPWMGNPDRLSNAQIAQVLRFTAIASREDLVGKGNGEKRIAEIKSKASGPTGVKLKERTKVLHIGRIVTIAQAKNIPVPPEVIALMTRAGRTTAGGGTAGAPPSPTFRE